jgi:alkylation response protein AidB-like acyl-CoA dehydrogenase
MSEYRAPVEDIRFVLDHIARIDKLAELPGFEHAEPDLISGMLSEASRFMTEIMSPLNEIGDRQGCKLTDGEVITPEGFKQAYKKFAEAGWNAVGLDPNYGGGGLPYTLAVVIQEMFASANMAFGLCPALGEGAIEALLDHGTEELKNTFLPNLVGGVWTATMDLTEPQAGSDLGSLRTVAKPSDDGSYLISGTKIFITYGDHDLAENIIHLVLARVPDAPKGTRGISCFIVPKFLVNEDGSLGERNDMHAVSLEHKIGIHASPTAVMSYGENGNCVGYLIGEENEGLRYMFTMMNRERIFVGAQGLGVAERAYQRAVEYACERRQGRALGAESPSGEMSLIVEHADVRRMLLTMRSQIEAMRCLLYSATAGVDMFVHHPDAAERERAGSRVALLTPVVKAWMSDLGVEIASLGVQVHGGTGFIEETGAAQHWRDARIAPIYEGTNGIQSFDLVMRKIPMNEGAIVRAFIEELRGILVDVEAVGDAVSSVAPYLARGIETLETATGWLLEHIADNKRAVAAAASPYLRLFGFVAGAALLARGAVVAQTLINDGDQTPSLPAKITVAKFFAEHLLPQALAQLGAVTAGDDALFEIPADQL